MIKSPDFDINLTVERFQKGEIPADYRILDQDTLGIDPYVFLGLNAHCEYNTKPKSLAMDSFHGEAFLGQNSLIFTYPLP